MRQNARSPFAPPLHRPSRLSGILTAVAVLLSLLLFPLSARALPPSQLLLDNPALHYREGALILSLSVSVNDEEGLREMLKDGSVLELMTTVSIERERSWWANAEEFSYNFPSVLRHDPLSRDFIATLPAGDGERELRDRNLTRLLHESWKKLSFSVIPLASLQDKDPEESFLLNFTITLRHIEVPPWLEKSLVFWSAEVVPPERGSLPIELPAPPVR